MADIIDLDNILENDIMDALSDLGTTSAPNPKIKEDIPIVDDITIPEPVVVSEESQSINTSSSSANIDNITTLLKELLNNKTIEITIKIKDS